MQTVKVNVVVPPAATPAEAAVKKLDGGVIVFGASAVGMLKTSSSIGSAFASPTVFVNWKTGEDAPVTAIPVFAVAGLMSPVISVLLSEYTASSVESTFERPLTVFVNCWIGLSKNGVRFPPVPVQALFAHPPW